MEKVTYLRFECLIGREETKEFLTDIENQYREKWEVFINAMPSILKQFKDDCLDCKGIRWATNI